MASKKAFVPEPNPFSVPIKSELPCRYDSLSVGRTKYLPPAIESENKNEYTETSSHPTRPEKHPHGFYETPIRTTEAKSPTSTPPAISPSQFQESTLPRPSTLKGIRAAYCARCMFWLSEGWISLEAECQSLSSFIDNNTTGLDSSGRDIDGHIRINSSICPICIRERMIVYEARNEIDRKERLAALDSLLRLWAEGRLIGGMKKDIMDVKRGILAAGEEESEIRKGRKVKREKSPPLIGAGKMQAIVLGLCTMSEMLARI